MEGEMGGAVMEEIDAESEKLSCSRTAVPEREGKNHLLYLNAFPQSGNALSAER